MAANKQDAALEALLDVIGRSEHFADEVITDAVLIVGSQYVDDDGDRCGHVYMFPRHGSQPAYITMGLIKTAGAWMSHRIGGS
ncbi:hypothetical protein NM962_01195 [Mycobacterium sp. SVM_VP21]|nr:hypothetical protein NM962_01195 [Mycobacterium sp. SVM_VP21]